MPIPKAVAVASAESSSLVRHGGVPPCPFFRWPSTPIVVMGLT